MQVTTLSKEQAERDIETWRFKYRQNPESYEAAHNLASCEFTLGNVEEALRLFHHSYYLWEKNPCADLGFKQAPICINLGMCYKELNDFDSAVEWVTRGYRHDREYWYNALAYCESELREARWQEVWPIYNGWARPTKNDAKDSLHLPPEIKEWNGEEAKLLIVIGEGGFGDRICYSRFLSHIKCPYIYMPSNGFNTDPTVYELFKRQEWFAPDSVRIAGPIQCESPEGVYWTTDFSLPGKLNARPDNLPHHASQLKANPRLICDFAYLTKMCARPTLGFAWAAGERFEGGRRFRSLTQRQAMRIVGATCTEIQWVNLKHDEQLPWPVINPRIETWDDTLAIIANMDGIVAMDCGPMHVAGAMDKPLWIVLGGNSDWKFLRAPKQCPWYPNARLFRNQGRGFDNAVESVIEALAKQEFTVSKESAMVAA
jgi:hypothetical protein